MAQRDAAGGSSDEVEVLGDRQTNSTNARPSRSAEVGLCGTLLCASQLL